MGGQLISDKTLNPLMLKWDSPNFKPLHGKFVSAHTMHFRDDWNWLIPVIHKLKLDISSINDMDSITDLCYDIIINI